MDKPTLIVSLLLVIASAMAFFFRQRISKVEKNLQTLQESKKENQTELENSRKTAKRRGEELESVRGDLQTARSKLKKLQRKEQDKKGANKNQQKDSENGSHVGAVIRVKNEELETRHEAQLDALQAQIAELNDEVRAHKAAEDKIKADTKKAARALKLNAASDVDELDPEALKTQIEALKRAAFEREGDLKRDLKRAKGDARAHERRASTNHQLYQVAKGQLSILEDRLARIKLKYEGATDPSKLVKAKVAAKAPATETAPEADEPVTVEADETAQEQAAPSTGESVTAETEIVEAVVAEAPAKTEAADNEDAPKVSAPGPAVDAQTASQDDAKEIEGESHSSAEASAQVQDEASPPAPATEPKEKSAEA
jgi:hypothetical protein